MIATILVAGVAITYFVVRWHRKRRAEEKPGLEPTHAIIGGLVFVVLGALVAIGGVGWTKYIRPSAVMLAEQKPALETSYTETRIRLDREAGSEINFVSKPENQKNIYTWQQVYNAIILKDSKTGKEDPHRVDAFFFIFDKPITYQRPRIDAYGQKIPAYEFYLNSDRGVVLMFKEMLTAPAFEIYFPPPDSKEKIDAPAPPDASPKSKFYSQGDKDRLAEALYVISTDLTDNAMKSVEETANLAQLVQAQIGLLSVAAEKVDPDKLAAKAGDIRNLLTQHESSLYSIVIKNDAYRDELNSVWGNDRGSQALVLFREALDKVDASINSLRLAKRSSASSQDALNVVGAILQTMPLPVGIAQERADQFGKWANETRKRIDQQRAALK